MTPIKQNWILLVSIACVFLARTRAATSPINCQMFAASLVSNLDHRLTIRELNLPPGLQEAHLTGFLVELSDGTRVFGTTDFTSAGGHKAINGLIERQLTAINAQRSNSPLTIARYLWSGELVLSREADGVSRITAANESSGLMFETFGTNTHLHDDVRNLEAFLNAVMPERLSPNRRFLRFNRIRIDSGEDPAHFLECVNQYCLSYAAERARLAELERQSLLVMAPELAGELRGRLETLRTQPPNLRHDVRSPLGALRNYMLMYQMTQTNPTMRGMAGQTINGIHETARKYNEIFVLYLFALEADGIPRTLIDPVLTGILEMNNVPLLSDNGARRHMRYILRDLQDSSRNHQATLTDLTLREFDIAFNTLMQETSERENHPEHYVELRSWTVVPPSTP